MLVNRITKAAAMLSALAATAVLVPAAAWAEDRLVTVYAEPSDAAIELVRFADLNLASTSGVRRLQARVGGAIERVCDIDLGRDGLQDRGFYACANSARDDAETQIAQAAAAARSMAANGAPATLATAITVRALAR